VGGALQEHHERGDIMTRLIESIRRWVAAHRFLRAPVLTGAALRMALMLIAYARTGTQIMTQGDTASYLISGRNLLQHGQFASGGSPEIDRTPGYPLFAMLTGMMQDNVLVTVLAQIVVSTLALLLIGRIAELVFPGTRAVYYATWLYALEPISILYTVRLMPETLFVLLLLCVIERLLSFYVSGKLASVAIAGVFLTSATFVRPVSYYLIFALAIGLAFTAPRVRQLWWKVPAILLVCTLPWLAAWQLRNRIETGYSGFSSIVEKNLYFYQSAEVTAELAHISLGAQQTKLGYLDDASYLAVHPEQRLWTQAQRLAYMHSQALQILSAHRALYLRTHFAGVAVVAFTPCATELLQLLRLYPDAAEMPHRILNEGVLSSLLRVLQAEPVTGTVMILLELVLLAFYAAAIYGLCRGSGKILPKLLLAAVALYFLLISGGAQAVGRYRVPVMPELCIVAGGGLAVLRKERSGAANGPAHVAL
jgi:Dolichyl-phosphate-mannose-protein mannosyltransferase